MFKVSQVLHSFKFFNFLQAQTETGNEARSKDLPLSYPGILRNETDHAETNPDGVSV